MLIYISYFQSKYHGWFQDLGYPELDIMTKENGEWWIIQYYNSPVIPCLTKWQTVLGPMRNVEISYGFCHKYTQKLDITKRAFWDAEEAKSREVEEEWEAREKHNEDLVERAHEAFVRNPDFMERFAKNGVKEMDLSSFEKVVPRSEIVKPRVKGVAAHGEPISGETVASELRNSSEPAQQNVHAGMAKESSQ